MARPARLTDAEAPHDASGIAALDFELARRAEDLAGRRARPTP